MANTIVGKQILWGNTSCVATITGTTDLTLMQDAEFSRGADKEKVKNADGNTAALVYTDHEDTLTLNFYPHNGTTAFATLASSGILSPGSTLAVVDSYTQWVSGTYAVDKFTQTRSNSKAMLWKFDLSKYPNTTCPAS